MKLNLKFKILIVILTLLTISTGTNIYYSYKSFVDDKKAYLFDASLKKAEGITDQINQELSLFQFLAENSLSSNESVNALVKNNSFIATFDYNTEYNDVSLIKENTQSPLFLKETLTNFINQSKKANGNDFKLRQQQLYPELINNKLVFAITFPNQTTSSLIRVVLFSGDKIQKLIQNDTQTKNFLSWTSNAKSTSLGQQILIDAELNEFKNSSLVKVSKETKQTIDNKDYLVSLNRSSLFNYVLVSGVSAEIAFKITEDLIIKTVLFSLFLFGIFFSVGIIFSAQITTPIKELTNAAEDVARGVYDYKENIKSNDELKILGTAFEKMSGEIKDLLFEKEEMIEELAKANEQLDQYNKNLEGMVQERTRQLNEANAFMSAMINSLDQGLVVFNRDLKILPIYTKASTELFHQEPKNKTFPELLGKTNAEEIQTLEQWAQITFNNVIPFESAVGLAPDHIKFGNNVESTDFQQVQISYYPMKNSEDEIQNIVAVATDKTSTVVSEYQFKKQEAYVQMILKILRSKSSFYSFIEEVENVFQNFKNCYNEDDNSINIELAMMLFHTLNGGFGLFRLFDLQKEARANEQFIIDSKSNLEEILPQFAEELTIRIKGLRKNFYLKLTELDETLGTNFSSRQVKKEVSDDKLKSFHKNMKNYLSELESNVGQKLEFLKLIKEFETEFIMIPMIDFVKPYEELCIKTAEKLGKEIAQLNIINGDEKLNPEKFQEFFNVLIHLFRNSIDHGIEAAHKRQENGKPTIGHISVSLEKILNESYIITIEDDGAGINPERVRQKLRELDTEKNYDQESDKEIVYHIFDPFFSTKEEVTELSGRGVGMSAIKEVVDRLNGTIEVESHLNKGTRFVFTLPQ